MEGVTEKDPLSVKVGGGEDMASFNWGPKLQLLFIFLFPLKIVRVVLDFVFFPYRPIQKRNHCLSLEYKRRQCLPHPSTPLHITIPCVFPTQTSPICGEESEYQGLEVSHIDVPVSVHLHGLDRHARHMSTRRIRSVC